MSEHEHDTESSFPLEQLESSVEKKEVPLIWTTEGNLPIEILEYKYYWLDSPKETVFVEEYYLEGHLVKRSPHVLLRDGNDPLKSKQESLGTG